MYVHVSPYRGVTRVRILCKVLVNGVRRTRLVEHIGTTRDSDHLALLRVKAAERLAMLRPQASLFDTLSAPGNMTSPAPYTPRVILGNQFAYGLWQVMGGLYDRIGLPDGLLKYLVLARIALPKSKLATARYLKDTLQCATSPSAIYRYMDTLSKDTLLRQLVAYAQSQARQRTGRAIAVVFYDVTTLYFEADDEDEDTVISQAATGPLAADVNRETAGSMAGQNTDESENNLSMTTSRSSKAKDDGTEPNGAAQTIAGLRKKGYSKDHRADLPQIVIGLTVDGNGFPLDFRVYEGNTYEGHTLLDGIAAVRRNLQLDAAQLTVVADAGMLSAANLDDLDKQGYTYIVGARIRSLDAALTNRMTAWDYRTKGPLDTTVHGRRLVVTYSDKRAKRNRLNRERLIRALQARLDRGQVVKKSKYVILDMATTEALTDDSQLPMPQPVHTPWQHPAPLPRDAKTRTPAAKATNGRTPSTGVADDTGSQTGGSPGNRSDQSRPSSKPKLTGRLDHDRLAAEARLDGLKGYVTNTPLPPAELVGRYTELWHVEQSFRMSKTDLRARPAYHHKRQRIIAHLVICVCSLAVLREFERAVKDSTLTFGLSRALEQLLAIRSYEIALPNNQTLTAYSQLSEDQERLLGL